jgi:hypothetical protein
MRKADAGLAAGSIGIRQGACPTMGVSPTLAIPAKAGIQETCGSLDSGLRRNDVSEVFSDSLLGNVPHITVRSEG